jgi:predicted O-methyltransferase YrrM
MSADSPVTVMRRSVKRMVGQKQFRWLDGPARRGWYYMRTISELAKLPTVLLGFRKDVRSRSPSELVNFIFDRFDGMFRPFQNKTELRRFIERVAAVKPKTIVEIGTARGGTLFLLSCVAHARARIVSIDLPAGPFGGGYPSWKGLLYRWVSGADQSLHLIRGNSHSESTFNLAVNALKGDKVDLLFIDGDHAYAGAKQDFIRYRTLVRPGGLIIFHDILESMIDKNINVAPLWQEVTREFQTEEIVESYNQGQFGIGVMTVPNRWNDDISPALPET